MKSLKKVCAAATVSLSLAFTAGTSHADDHADKDTIIFVSGPVPIHFSVRSRRALDWL
ncbi:MAG: hypothetical protein AAF468_17550 [Pseudomonadota bacterium]